MNLGNDNGFLNTHHVEVNSKTIQFVHYLPSYVLDTDLLVINFKILKSVVLFHTEIYGE